MEYPRLHAQATYKLDSAKDRKAVTERNLEAERATFQRLIERAEKKGDAIALYEAHWDDDEPQFAEEVYRNEGVDKILEGIEAREQNIRNKLNYIDEAKRLIRKYGGLVTAIFNYRPSAKQAKRKVVQDEFFFAPGEKWMEFNRERRREQEARTNSLFKTFQDIFTRHNYRIIPKREGKFGSMDFDHISLDPVIVDPERISDTFLETFRNQQFGLVPPKKDLHPYTRLQKKEEMIPAVKRFFFDHVSPLHRSSWDDEDVNHRLWVVKDYHPDQDGFIIYPRYDSSEDESIRGKRIYTYKSAYSARRQANRLYGEYEGESNVLLSIKYKIERVRDYLEKIKDDDPKKADKLEKCRIALRQLVDNLKNPKQVKNPKSPQNIYKSSAYKRLFSASELQDVRKRLNKGASLAKLVGVCNDLQFRLEEVDDISVTGPQDNNTLNAEITQSENVLQACVDTEMLREYINTGDIGQFEKLKEDLEKIKVRPFNLYAIELTTLIERMRYARDRKRRIKLTTRFLAISRLFGLQKNVEDVIYRIDREKPCNADYMIGMLEDLTGAAEQSRVQGYVRRLNRPEKYLTALHEQFSQKYAGKNLIFGVDTELKEKLKKIDFEAVLRAA